MCYVHIFIRSRFPSMLRRKGAKPYKGQAPFLFRLPPQIRGEWAENDASLPTHNLGTSDGALLTRDRKCLHGSTGSPQSGTLSNMERRHDMPVVRKRELGASSLAVEAARSVRSRHQAVMDLERDMYAKTSSGPREALLATWEKFHCLWYGEDLPVIPLTEEKLVHVTSLFKAGGYKSYKNYLSRIKDAHVMAGYPWTDILQRVAQKCSRSALRGLAGPIRSDAFELLRAYDAAKSLKQAVCEGGPVHPAPMIVCATFFMLREIEASGIQVVDLTFGHQSVTISLPVSKVDWKAKGTKRTWQCICGTYDICPFHVILDHFQNLENKHETAPLFPSYLGGFCTKGGVTATIRRVASLAGQQVQDASGAWLISGHTFRVTGARTLACLGLDAITIQLLGRWGSDAVLTYLAEAPLSNLGEKLHGPLVRSRLTSLSSSSAPIQNDVLANCVASKQMLDEHLELKSQLEDLTKQLADLKYRTSDIGSELEGVTQLVSKRTPLEEWQVDNEQSGVIHRALVSLNSSPSSWMTMCGWKFAGKTHADAVTHRLEEDAKRSSCCKRCPKCHKHLSLSSDTSSSDESSV